MVLFRLEIGLNQQLLLKNQYSLLLTLSDFWGKQVTEKQLKVQH